MGKKLRQDPSADPGAGSSSTPAQKTAFRAIDSLGTLPDRVADLEHKLTELEMRLDALEG
jgi:uncharacterized protein YceH (UPF0502 family)